MSKEIVANNIKKMAHSIVGEAYSSGMSPDALQAHIEKMMSNLANQAYILGKNSK